MSQSVTNACRKIPRDGITSGVSHTKSIPRTGGLPALKGLMPGICYRSLKTVVWLACGLPLFAVTLQQMTMDQVTQASTEIVYGSVTKSYTSMTGSTIFTHYQVRVTEQWKGPFNQTVDVAMPGGVLGGIRQTFPGVPALQVGSSYVLYLWTGSTGPTQPVGLIQGIFAVGQESGQTVAARRASGELMIGPAGTAVADQGVSMQLAAMRTSVQAVVNAGKTK
jgi:hypothetical protein